MEETVTAPTPPVQSKSQNSSVTKLTEDIQKLSAYQELYQDVQKLTATATVKVENFKESLVKEMKETGLETKLRNSVYHWAQREKSSRGGSSASSSACGGGHDTSYLRKAQMQWDRRVHKSLQSMCSELGIQLAKVRITSDKEEIMEKWGELSTYDVDVHMYRPVYAPKDFLEVILALQPNRKKKTGQPKWEFSHLPLKVKTLHELRKLYAEYSRGEPLLGVACPQAPQLEAERLSLGDRVLHARDAPVAQEYLKKGAPRCHRAKLWALVLGAEVRDAQRVWFAQLKESVLQLDLMIDKLIIKDIHLTAANDDQYFVFEDVLFQIMLCFSRDTEVARRLPGGGIGGGAYMRVTLKGRSAQNVPSSAQSLPEHLHFPPSGVIPFHGFCMYAAPLCYLYDDPVHLYFAFRAFYLRHWHRLHRVCSHPQGIVSLCLLYERLLQCHEPALWTHFTQNGVQPTRVVFKWLMRAFSGHLPPEQLLYLWDAVLAYDSLEIIPLLAVTILSLRKENLLQVTTLLNIEAVLADLSSIAVMPLIQTALCHTSRSS